MNEEPMPGTSAADQELARRWRRQSLEEPSSSTDARIRAAARDAIASSAPSGSREVRNRSRWTRFMPLAAAASVALLAVGLVRLIPREQYQAVPTPEARPTPRDNCTGIGRTIQTGLNPVVRRASGGRSLYAEPSAPESRDEAERTTARARALEPAPDSDLTPRTGCRGRHRRGDAQRYARGGRRKRPGISRASSEGQRAGERSAGAGHGDCTARDPRSRGATRIAPHGFRIQVHGERHSRDARSPGTERRRATHGSRPRLRSASSPSIRSPGWTRRWVARPRVRLRQKRAYPATWSRWTQAGQRSAITRMVATRYESAKANELASGARGRSRTGKGLPPRDFKSLASTSFATRASRSCRILHTSVPSYARMRFDRSRVRV